MKIRLIMLTTLAFALSLSTVSSANAKVPAFTTGIEKASVENIAPVANTNGAIVNLTPIRNHQLSEGTFVSTYKLAKIHWVVDETFYSTGYKSLLNKEVSEIFAPPKGEYRS